MLWQQPGTGFDKAYLTAKRKAMALAVEYAALLDDAE